MKNLRPLILALCAFVLCGSMQSLFAQFAGQVVNLSLDRYNSTPSGEKETVHDGDNLAVIHFRGWTPAATYQTGASIGVDVTDEPAPGYLPAKMTFYTGGMNQLPRMTILENGWIGIGTTTPQDLLDINGNTIIRGANVWFGLNSNFGDGGLAFRHQADNGFDGFPTDVLGINSTGEFEGGVYIGCPGLRVCGTLEAECIKAIRHLSANEGNIVAFGDSGMTIDCEEPGEGDFIAYGNNGDFIAHHGHFIANEGDFQALQGNVVANQDVTAENGNVAAPNGNVSAGIDLIAQTGNVHALQGNVVANQDVTAENGNVAAPNGNVSAGIDLIAQTGNVHAQQGNVVANQDVTAENGNVAAPNGNVSAGQDLNAGGQLNVSGDALIGGVARIGNITGDPGTHTLAVGGSIIATEVKVALQDDWPDYVFKQSYSLPTLAEIKRHIETKGHLPGLPSAREVSEAGGIELGEQQRLLTQKVEELYLHIIQLNERVEVLEKENEALREALKRAGQ